MSRQPIPTRCTGACGGEQDCTGCTGADEVLVELLAFYAVALLAIALVLAVWL